MDLSPTYLYAFFTALGILARSSVLLIMAGIIGIISGLMLLSASVTDLDSLFSFSVIGSSVIVIGIGISATLDRD